MKRFRVDSRSLVPGSRRSGRRGAILVVLIVLLLVAASIAGAVLRAILIDARQFTTDRQVVQADRLAEAGLGRAAARLGADPTYAGEEWAAELAGGDRGTVVITVTSSDGRRTVEAAASYPAGDGQGVRSRRAVVIPIPKAPGGAPT